MKKIGLVIGTLLVAGSAFAQNVSTVLIIQCENGVKIPVKNLRFISMQPEQPMQGNPGVSFVSAENAQTGATIDLSKFVQGKVCKVLSSK